MTMKKVTYRLATACAAAMLAAGLSSTAMAGESNNASEGNDRTMVTQYSRTLMPIGGTKGESNRWDVSYWTGVTTKVASKPETLQYGFNDRDYYNRGMYYPNGQPYHSNWKNGW